MFISLRPLLSFDPITVQPQVEITLANDDQPKESLDEILEYLKKHDGQFIVAIDEFQQILVYPEQNVEALHDHFTRAPSWCF